MLAFQAAIMLPLLSLIPPCAGGGSVCSCNITNSRCDEFGVCRCDPGWDGELCEHCVPMPGCVHGSCLQPWQCTCEPGWGGRFCDKDLSVCSQEQPCQNGATCVMENTGDFTCLCPEGFHGPTCRKRTGPCYQKRSPCKNGGLCEDAEGFAAELTCLCLAGFTGHLCETDIDDCLMMPCATGATCVDGVNRFSCLCPLGFIGRFCTISLDDCSSQPCRNGGRCLDRARGFHCVCQPGFTGTTCETQLNHSNASSNASSNTSSNTSSNASSNTSSNTSQHSWGTLGWDSGLHEDRPLKVTVSERSAASLSGLQLIIVLVLVVVTLGAMVLTTILITWGRCRDGCPAPCWPPSSQGSERNSRQAPRDEPECQISFLNTAEPQKKRLNVEVVQT